MRILQSGLNSKLNIEHSLQAQSDQGAILVVEASELPNCRVSSKSLLVARNELGEVGAANLFLTFDRPFEIAGNGSGRFQERVNRHQSRDDVSLVIARPSRVDFAVLHCCRERSILPELKRLDRLHIIMVVEDQRLSPDLGCEFSEYNRRTRARRECLHRETSLS